VRTLQRWTYEVTHWLQLADRKPPLLAGLGVTFLALSALVVALILMSFSGDFSTYDTVTAQLPAEGSAVALDSPVEYRDVTVGKVVTNATGGPGGTTSVVLHIEPARLHDIPANVAATVAPLSIFGNQYVVLVPPSAPRGLLANGQTVRALTQGPTANVQVTLAELDRLLVQIHPAELFSSLSALADALQGEGQSIGVTLVRFNSYLKTMDPLWPQTISDFKLLVPVAGNVAAATPDLVATLANLTVTGTTVSSQAAAIDQLFVDGTQFSGLTTGLLTNIESPYDALAAASGPFLQSLSQTPTTIAQILQGLDAWARTWVAAEANGPYLSLTASPLQVHNAADLALGVLGGANVASLYSGALGPQYVNPPTYTAADCPRYGSLAGPNCGGLQAARTAADNRLIAALGPVSILPAPAEKRATATIATGLAGGTPPPSADVATLLLSPVLSDLVVKK
jgi:phospholipid/cholesterol/gamma-HCH transport system substrate-binding protein